MGNAIGGGCNVCIYGDPGDEEEVTLPKCLSAWAQEKTKMGNRLWYVVRWIIIKLSVVWEQKGSIVIGG